MRILKIVFTVQIIFNIELVRLVRGETVEVQDAELQMLSHLGIKLLPDEEKTVGVSCVARSSVELPCNLTSPLKDDQVRLVLWFKNDSAKPIYTYDTRGKSYLSARHWSDDAVLEGRAFFRGDNNPGRLVLDNINPYDQGLYKCRVDFATAPTRISSVMLDVIVPPEKPRIHDESNQEVRLKLGPYKLGETVTITCEVLGGRPSPSVTWWRDHHLVDDSFMTDTQYKVTNQLVIPNISRNDLHSIFTCQASNNNVSVPVSTSVKLDITFGPSSVRLLGVKQSVSAGQPHEVRCEAVGARPAPDISWWRNEKQIVSGVSRPQTSPDGNVTVSSLWITALEQDDGDIITCKAGNPKLPKSTVQSSWNLQVNYKPKVQLSFGSQLEASNIKEGNDVYFECKVKSHPRHYKITWKRNGETLFHDVSSGIIISNQSLVVQRVTRSDSGQYTCHVFNSEGEGVSNAVSLTVKYAPVCSSGSRQVFGVARQERVAVTCEVNANPVENMKFDWIFSKGDEKLDMQQSQIRVNGTKSILDYVPRTEMDYGDVLCWATNDVGKQSQPCVYHIIPAGRPDPVVNCSISNQSQSSFLVSCSPGFNGGLAQVFGLEVLDAETSRSILNMTSQLPKFQVVGLLSEKSFTLTVHSSNLRGQSEKVILRAHTTKPPETVDILKSEKAKIGSLKTRLIISPVLGVLIGVGGAIVLVSITLFAIMCFRVKYEKLSQSLGRRKRSSASTSGNSDKEFQDDLYVDLTDNSPDLIPSDEFHSGGGGSETFSRSSISRDVCSGMERKYSTLQTHHFKSGTDYETIKLIHNNINTIGRQSKNYTGAGMVMPTRHHCNREFYSPITTDSGVIYAQVDKKGKKLKKPRQGNELHIFNTSSSSSSVRDVDCDGMSVETPLVTSEDGRSSSNSEESKFNKINNIKYEDRESQV